MASALLRALVFVILACAVGGCAGAPKRAAFSRKALSAELKAELDSVSVVDGVSKPEAELIAKSYFHRHVGCGMFTGIRDGGRHWIVDGGVGYFGKPIEGFKIDKETGSVTSPIGPSYGSPSDIMRE
jgi:hypothetical protein